MKLLILPLLIASIGIAEARVYKCPGKVEGRYTYQEKPCSKAEGAAEKNKVDIVPVNKKRVKAAVEKLNHDLKDHKKKKDDAAKASDKSHTEINVTMPTKKVEDKSENNQSEEDSGESENSGG
ncbi:MAG: hypothetical protein Q9M50_01020 [Methylococcales bacterium]|nr:hypothetical protein [Methylococcales bacterium]